MALSRAYSAKSGNRSVQYYRHKKISAIYPKRQPNPNLDDMVIDHFSLWKIIDFPDLIASQTFCEAKLQQSDKNTRHDATSLKTRNFVTSTAFCCGLFERAPVSHGSMESCVERKATRYLYQGFRQSLARSKIPRNNHQLWMCAPLKSSKADEWNANFG